MNYKLHPEALQEYEDAAFYYADAVPGLELRFITSAEAAIGRIADNPARWRILEGEVRRCLVAGFPY